MPLSPNIPEALLAGLRAEAAGASRKDLARRSADISEGYRAHRPSSQGIADAADVLAYVLGRAPATYAAVASVLAELQERLPDWAPATTLDVGAGPGTASWVLAEAYPDIARMGLLDHNRYFLDMARRLAAASGHAPLAAASVGTGDLKALQLAGASADLVIVSYALTELADADLTAAAAALWKASAGVLVIVEPGTTRDYQRLMAVRAALVGQGASIVAPCPHADACPLPEGDWCHFSVRLQRSRDHRQVKGAAMAYEDEKFSYLVLARPGLAAEAGFSRILRQPIETKFSVDLALCTPAGLRQQRVLKRDALGFKALRKAKWGDSLPAIGNEAPQSGDYDAGKPQSDH